MKHGKDWVYGLLSENLSSTVEYNASAVLEVEQSSQPVCTCNVKI